MKLYFQSLLGLALFAASSAFAGTIYQVDFMVYSTVTKKAINSEYWQASGLNTHSTRLELKAASSESSPINNDNQLESHAQATPPEDHSKNEQEQNQDQNQNEDKNHVQDLDTNTAKDPSNNDRDTGAQLPERLLTLLPSSELELKKTEQRLSKHYPLLCHLAWRQTIGDKNTSALTQPIHIHCGKMYTEHGDLLPMPTSTVNADTKATDRAGKTAHPEVFITPDSNPVIQAIDGTLRLSLNRYIRAQLNLQYSVPLGNLPGGIDNERLHIQGPFAQFQLLQSRRMRSNELNVFYHPVYFVVMTVTPIDQSSSDTA